VEEQYKPRTTGAVMFVSLRLYVISILWPMDFWLGWGKWLWLERKV